MSCYLESIESIASGVVRAAAVEIDRTAAFPAAAIAALRKAGLLGLISANEAGGMGLETRPAAEVVERLARECGSTAMVACMHYAAAVIEARGSRTVGEVAAAGRQSSPGSRHPVLASTRR